MSADTYDNDSPTYCVKHAVARAKCGCPIPARLIPVPDPVDVDDLSPSDSDGVGEHRRHVVLTPASTIKPRPVRWIWNGRLAKGTLALIAGPEGLGKSTLAYWMTARITRGELPGEYQGQPKSVLVCASEDSWEHTIVPRLIAAGADLDRVYRVEVKTADEFTVGLSLPRDLKAVESHAVEKDAAMLVLDPLMSRLGDELDTYRDGDVRQALEPLVAIADRTGMAIVGLIHHNKSGSTDPLQLVMASKAFTAVARSVHSVIRDPDDDTDTRRLFGTPKNNLGRGELPTLSFTIAGCVIPTDEGDAHVGRLVWGDDVAGSIGDAMRRGAEDSGDRSATAEAAEWLTEYLFTQGGRDSSAEIKKAGKKVGHAEHSLKKARSRLGLKIERKGYPGETYWLSPVGTQSEHPPRGEFLTVLTVPTEDQSEQSEQSEQLERHGAQRFQLDIQTGTTPPSCNQADTP